VTANVMNNNGYSSLCQCRQLATSMLADAGFGDVQVREFESDPINYYYVARK
jgi:hypothetical protein